MGDARSELEHDFLAPWPLQGEWIRLELSSCNPGCQLHVEDNAKSFNWTAVKSMLQDAHATICTEEGIQSVHLRIYVYIMKKYIHIHIHIYLQHIYIYIYIYTYNRQSMQYLRMHILVYSHVYCLRRVGDQETPDLINAQPSMRWTALHQALQSDVLPLVLGFRV